MELRSYNHLHFIQVINGNSVIKLLNVTGSPVLRFKNVKEIYEAGGIEHHESVPTTRPENELESMQFDPNRAEFENPRLPFADRRTVSFDSSEFASGNGNEGKTNNLDGFCFDNITLKEIKEICKARKRKCAEYVVLNEETSNNFFPPKQDHNNLEAEEDELDLKEPLIRWKSKISKNKKSKRKYIRSHMSTSSQNEQDPVDQIFLHPNGNLLEPTDSKLEVNETDYSNSQTKICAAADSSFHCNEQVDYCGVVIDEACVADSECVMETDASTSFDEEKTCIVNGASCEYMKHDDPESVSNAGVSGWEIVNVDSPEILSYEYPDLPVVNFENEVYIHPVLGHVSLETISKFEDHVTDIYNSQSLSTIHSLSWSSSSDSQVQALDMVIDNRLHCMEIINGDGAYLLEGGIKDDFPSDIKASVSVIDCSPSRGSDSCLGPNTFLVSSVNDFPLADQKQPFLSTCANALRNCSAAMHPSDATHGLTASSESEDYHHLELQRPPERLLSTRKFQAISPTSQERLCKAMNSIELNEDEHSECRGKLIFGNQTEDKVINAEGGNEIRRAEIACNTKHVLRTSKYDKKGSDPKANLKCPHLSRTVPSLSTGCTSTQNLSQSAIAFSQRQMHDIEYLATKLMAELSSMKEVVKEMVHSDVCPATSLKHNIAKVTMAIKNASKAEETSKKWLSIMARDCNRFCKIMTLTKANSTAPGNVVHKERRKITFADEAGGKLCHVKIFNNDMASPQESIDIEE